MRILKKNKHDGGSHACMTGGGCHACKFSKILKIIQKVKILVDHTLLVLPTPNFSGTCWLLSLTQCILVGKQCILVTRQCISVHQLRILVNKYCTLVFKECTLVHFGA